MENKKLTTVEHIQKAFYSYAKSGGLDNDQWKIYEQDFDKMLELALELEKQKLKEAYFAGTMQFDNAAPIVRPKTFEEYYSETFGK